MSRLHRIRIVNSCIIALSADAMWSCLTDWGLQQLVPVPAGYRNPLGITGIELIGEAWKVPRTRVLRFKNLPEIRETLLYQNDADRHLYYNIEGDGPFGIRNYLATTEIDALAPDLSQISINARFDLVPDADVAAAKAFIDSAHINGVFGRMKALANSR